MKSTTNSNSRFILFTLIVTLFTLIGCRPSVELTNPINYHPRMNDRIDWPVVFESYWNAMNNNYLFWDIDPTDWDAVYDTYSPKFASMGISTAYSDVLDKGAEAHGYFEEMTANLVDGHYTLWFSVYKDEYGEDIFHRLGGYPDRSKANGDPRNSLFSAVAHSGDNDWAMGIYDVPYDVEDVIKNYFPTDFETEYVSMEGEDLKIATGKQLIGGGSEYILYFYFNAFALTGTDAYDTDPCVVLLNKIMGTYFTDPDLKGVVVDIRGNGGGRLTDLSLFWGLFIDAPHTPAYTKFKAGAGRLDYTEYIPFRIFPAPATRRVAPDVKIALIVDRYSVSCSELSTMIVKTMPGREHRVFGETTFGGTSPLVPSNIGYVMYDGGITIPIAPGFWSQIYTPYAAVKCADGNVYEGKGVPPDVPIASDEAYWAAFAAGEDKRLEAAIDWLGGSF